MIKRLVRWTNPKGLKRQQSFCLSNDDDARAFNALIYLLVRTNAQYTIETR